MMEGTGLQLDPQLDVFSIARPYAQRALAEQFTPGAVGQRLAEESRSLSEIAFGLPHQVSDLLQRVNDGELRVQTREIELRRVAGALIGAANRLAIGIVLAALILGIGMVSLAIGLADWQGLLPRILLILGSIGVVVLGTLLGLALLRGRE
jgi:ubiquinone biosynthesis protein